MYGPIMTSISIINLLQLESGYLKHVFAVFDRIGYALGNGDSNWDVLWSHEYPFENLAKKMATLKPHQKVCCLLYRYTDWLNIYLENYLSISFGKKKNQGLNVYFSSIMHEVYLIKT